MKKKYLSVDEACKYLGVKRPTIYKYTFNKEIRHYRPFGKLYFKQEDLDEFIERGLVEHEIKRRERKKYNTTTKRRKK